MITIHDLLLTEKICSSIHHNLIIPPSYKIILTNSLVFPPIFQKFLKSSKPSSHLTSPIKFTSLNSEKRQPNHFNHSPLPTSNSSSSVFRRKGNLRPSAAAIVNNSDATIVDKQPFRWQGSHPQRSLQCKMRGRTLAKFKFGALLRVNEGLRSRGIESAPREPFRLNLDSLCFIYICLCFVYVIWRIRWYFSNFKLPLEYLVE